MTRITVEVTGTQAQAQVQGTMTCGTVGMPVVFHYDEAWDGLKKTAVFRAGGLSIDRVDVQTQTTVPWEVLRKKNCVLQIGVYGANHDGTVALPTVWADVGVIQPGADPAGDESTDPSLPVWQQLWNMLETGSVHAQSHGIGGDDPVTPESIGAASAEAMGDVEAALDSILAIQEHLMGGAGA